MTKIKRDVIITTSGLYCTISEYNGVRWLDLFKPSCTGDGGGVVPAQEICIPADDMTELAKFIAKKETRPKP